MLAESSFSSCSQDVLHLKLHEITDRAFWPDLPTPQIFFSIYTLLNNKFLAQDQTYQLKELLARQAKMSCASAILGPLCSSTRDCSVYSHWRKSDGTYLSSSHKPRRTVCIGELRTLRWLEPETWILHLCQVISLQICLPTEEEQSSLAILQSTYQNQLKGNLSLQNCFKYRDLSIRVQL